MSAKVAIVVGSIRKESFNRKVAEALIALAPSSLTLSIAEIKQLSFYNQDLDAAPPADWTEFRETIKQVDGVIFVTPEYNRSVPGVLKNAIDIGSRPYGHSVWNNKPAAVLSASPGAIGGFGANHALRQTLVFLNMPTLQQPEAYLGAVDKKLGPDGKVADDGFKDFLKKILEAYEALLNKHATK